MCTITNISEKREQKKLNSKQIEFDNAFDLACNYINLAIESLTDAGASNIEMNLTLKDNEGRAAGLHVGQFTDDAS